MRSLAVVRCALVITGMLATSAAHLAAQQSLIPTVPIPATGSEALVGGTLFCGGRTNATTGVVDFALATECRSVNEALAAILRGPAGGLDAGVTASAAVHGDVAAGNLYARAMFRDYYTISGPRALDDIYLVIIASTVTGNLNSNDVNTHAAVGAGSFAIDGTPSTLGGSDDFSVGSSPSQLRAGYFASGLFSTNAFFAWALAEVLGRGSCGFFCGPQSWAADVTLTLPTVTFLDSRGADITADYVLTRELYVPPVTAAPEPATLVLVGTGLLGLAGVRRRKKALD